jgi:cytolysin (calcineurin-like family phosphatase)
MGLDINIVSVPRAVTTQPADAYVGSRYDKNPRWKQVAYARSDWDLHDLLAVLYHKRGGTKEDFNNVNVRLYKRDLRLFDASISAPILEHMKKGRVVYAESSF